ncbi:MAG: hypothetical protein JO165_05735 [Candidatus Eremiobacteraeota bacterium]|nr:hypothetical protein [Candidatus Eremiobacteraeota bacterium]
MQSPQDVGNTFSRAWQLLSANWIIIVPAIVVGIICAILVGFITFTGGAASIGAGALAGGGAALGGLLLTGLLLAVIGALAYVITISYTTGMADAAWRTGTATLADGSAALSSRGSNVFVAAILYFILMVVAFMLAPFTIFLSVLAFVLFFLYTFAAVIVGGTPGGAALGESARIAMANFASTLLVVVLLILAGIVGAALSRIFHGIPFIGPIVQYVIQNVILAYATLVIVGEYIKVRTPVAATVTGTSNPPTVPPV